MRSNLHPLSGALLAAAQEINPGNVDDAYYIVCHRDEFTAAQVKQAEKTLEEYPNLY